MKRVSYWRLQTKIMEHNNPSALDRRAKIKEELKIKRDNEYINNLKTKILEKLNSVKINQVDNSPLDNYYTYDYDYVFNLVKKYYNENVEDGLVSFAVLLNYKRLIKSIKEASTVERINFYKGILEE